MADEKAVERAAARDDNSNVSKCSASSQPDLNAQGESLFLPYLVEHLRSSLQQQNHQQQPVPPARRRRHAPQVSVQHHECGRVEDSGTESGEDLRFLAAGLRDSIQLHRRGAREQETNQGILSEVQSALARLQSSLQKGCIGTEQVDSLKQDSLLQLIDRLQTSLQLPSAGTSWQKQSKPADLPRGGGCQRFAGRRNKRAAAHRHTVGVTREELADVRRFLEETAMRNTSVDKPPDVPPLPTMRSSYDLVKQCSAGDLPLVASQGSPFRPFRPTHFLANKFNGPPQQFHQVKENLKTTPYTLSEQNSDQIKTPNCDVESEDDEDEESDDDGTDFVEEKAVVGKAFKNTNNDTATSADYDPSSNLFTPSQSVQIAVHKAAINKQLSVEEEGRSENKEVEFETTDEDTITDASYESETEKAESDGYEEEDKEFEEDEDQERRNVRSNTKNTSGQAGIVRNMTYTIQPQSVNPPKKPVQTQDYKGQGAPHIARRKQDPAKQVLNENKKHAQKEPEIRMMHNRAYISAQQSQSARQEDKAAALQQRNPPPYVHHDVNHKSVETVKKNEADQWNGQGMKNPAKEASRSQMNDGCIEDHSKTRQDKNNNRPSDVSCRKNAVSEPSHSVQKQDPATANDLPKTARFANRQLKKQKMKRANTIDIPKPLHYYDVEEESEASSDGDSQKENPVRATKEIHKTDNKTVHKSTLGTVENVQRLREKHTDVRRASIPPKIEKKVKQMFEEVDNASYNPQAHGGAQWNSRFANIKTCFENPHTHTPHTHTTHTHTSPKQMKIANKKQSDAGLNRARSFWRSADDSTLKVSKNSAFHDPKLTKQGSEFLKKLHEQKDQGQPLQKLPWTATEHESVVVGSLVVPANVTKAMQPVQTQGPVNKFSHAPMSAFRPIEKKNPSPTGHTPWAAPSVTGSVKQIASSKFSLPDPQPPATVYKQEPPKQAVKAINLQAQPKAPAPVSPTLPWTKEVSHGHSLNSTLAKFESMSSRESSPQLTSNALLRSHSQDRISVASNFIVFNKNVPAPPPRTYIPVPQTNIVQTRTQNLTTPQRQELPFIPEQHPHPLMHSKSNQYLPQSSCFSGPIKNHPLLVGDGHASDSEDEPAPSSSRLVLSTLQGNIEPPPLRKDEITAPVQTYSAGVTARQSIYGVVQQSFVPKSAPMPEEDVDETYYDPELTHADFAEEHTAAVTRVMGRPQCQAAVTVSHKTRHYNEDEGERGSAAFHLASLLHKFSGDDDVSTTKATKEVQQKPKQPLAVSNSPENSAHVSAWTSQTSMCLAPAQSASLPPKPEGSPRLARVADTGYNRTVEKRSQPLPLYSDPDRMREIPRPLDRPPQIPSANDDTPECVYASRFEIPVNKVQNITMKFQSLKESQNEPVEERKPAVSPNPGVVLRKSESWHQLAAQQQGLTRRPQSMVVTDLPPMKPRSPNPIPKAKSSHSLAFPKQFEAAIKPEALEKKQKTVEEFFKKGKTEIKSNLKSVHAKIAQSVRSYSAESTGVLLLDDNMENVDEAFETLFNATSTDSKTKLSKSSQARDAKGPTSRIAHR